MIFNSNSTSLGSTVAMAEGYDCSIGTALALIESARNDNAMFNAMLGIEAQALKLEHSGYVAESSEVIALQEAAAGGILKKIGELFSKLASKIKAIFHTFFSKINSLFMSDVQMVKKYENELLLKDSELKLKNMEVKWRKHKNTLPEINSTSANETYITDTDNYKEDKAERDLAMYSTLGYDFIKEDDNVKTSFEEHYFEDADKMKLQDTDIKDIKGVITKLKSDMPKKIKKMQSDSDTLVRNIEKLAKNYRDAAGKIDTSKTNSEIDRINKEYGNAVSYQDCQLKINNAIIDLWKTEYKQIKAVFMKAISTNKKVEESSVWADAIEEAAADEVTEVMDKALSSEEISEINAASTAVKDADVSDDPDKLTYGPDQYTDNADYKVAGSVDSEVNSKSEAAFFGSMLY